MNTTVDLEAERSDRPRAGAMGGAERRKGEAERSKEAVAPRPPPTTTHHPVFAFLILWPDNFNWRP